MKKQSFSPYLPVILGATLAGANGSFVKFINFSIPDITFFRFAVPTIFTLLVFLYQKEKIYTGNERQLIKASIINAVRIPFYFIAFLYTTVSNAIIMIFTWPIFAAIFEVVLLKKKRNTRDIILILLAFFGVTLMFIGKEFSFENKDFLGMLAGTICGALYALSMIIFKTESREHSRTKLIFYQNVIGALIFFIILFFDAQLPTIQEIGIGTLLGLYIGVLVFYLFFTSLKQIRVTEYSLFAYLEVPSAVIFSMIIFHEQITWNMALGGTFILLSGYLIKNKPKPTIAISK